MGLRVDRWIDSTEVLARGKKIKVKNNIKNHVVLDYDL